MAFSSAQQLIVISFSFRTDQGEPCDYAPVTIWLTYTNGFDTGRVRGDVFSDAAGLVQAGVYVPRDANRLTAISVTCPLEPDDSVIASRPGIVPLSTNMVLPPLVASTPAPRAGTDVSGSVVDAQGKPVGDLVVAVTVRVKAGSVQKESQALIGCDSAGLWSDNITLGPWWHGNDVVDGTAVWVWGTSGGGAYIPFSDPAFQPVQVPVGAAANQPINFLFNGKGEAFQARGISRTNNFPGLVKPWTDNANWEPLLPQDLPKRVKAGIPNPFFPGGVSTSDTATFNSDSPVGPQDTPFAGSVNIGGLNLLQSYGGKTIVFNNLTLNKDSEWSSDSSPCMAQQRNGETIINGTVNVLAYAEFNYTAPGFSGSFDPVTAGLDFVIAPAGVLSFNGGTLFTKNTFIILGQTAFFTDGSDPSGLTLVAQQIYVTASHRNYTQFAPGPGKLSFLGLGCIGIVIPTFGNVRIETDGHLNISDGGSCTISGNGGRESLCNKAVRNAGSIVISAGSLYINALDTISGLSFFQTAEASLRLFGDTSVVASHGVSIQGKFYMAAFPDSPADFATAVWSLNSDIQFAAFDTRLGADDFYIGILSLIPRLNAGQVDGLVIIQDVIFTLHLRSVVAYSQVLIGGKTNIIQNSKQWSIILSPFNWPATDPNDPNDYYFLISNDALLTGRSIATVGPLQKVAGNAFELSLIDNGDTLPLGVIMKTPAP